MRLKYTFHGNDKEPHPFHVKSDWDPPVQPSVALETFLEEVKFDLASIKLNRPKDNLSLGERNALKELSRDKKIVLKKADKGTTTVIMNKEDKLNEGQVQLDDIHNYQPLDKPIVSTTAKKVHRLIQSLLQEGHIDDVAAKWLSLTPDPQRIHTFTLLHTYKDSTRKLVPIQWKRLPPNSWNMGTKLAVAFANIFMVKIEKEILRQSDTKPIVWKRFIDDVISMWNTSRDKIEDFLLKANSFHPTIKFTAETSETETTFLDAKVHKGVRFTKESIISYRNGKSLKDILVKAKL